MNTENTNNEVWIGDKMKFFLDKDNIINIVPVGDIDPDTASAAKAVVEKLASGIKGKVVILVDLNKAGKQSPEARKKWDEISEEQNASVALFGIHYVAKVIATFFMRFSRIKSTRFFNDREEALAWLKEEKKINEAV